MEYYKKISNELLHKVKLSIENIYHNLISFQLTTLIICSIIVFANGYLFSVYDSLEVMSIPCFILHLLIPLLCMIMEHIYHRTKQYIVDEGRYLGYEFSYYIILQVYLSHLENDSDNISKELETYLLNKLKILINMYSQNIPVYDNMFNEKCESEISILNNKTDN